MTKSPQSAARLIDDNGGSAAFSRIAGLSHGAVRMMKVRNRIPRTVWPEIITAFPDITMETLLATEASAQDAAA